jgi:hypothetical protein
MFTLFTFHENKVVATLGQKLLLIGLKNLDFLSLNGDLEKEMQRI